jgi:hypothetical protein
MQIHALSLNRFCREEEVDLVRVQPYQKCNESDRLD